MMLSNASHPSMTTGERILYRLPLMIFYIFILICGIFGNALVLYIYSRRLRIPIFGFFVKLLAVFDFFTPCVVIPCLMVFRFAPEQIDTSIMCKVLTFIKHFNAVNSGLVFIIIACQRYRLICKPHGRQMSEKLAKWLCAASVCLSFLGSIPIVFLLTDYEVFVRKGTHNVSVSICDFVSDIKGDVASTVYSVWIMMELVIVISTLTVLYTIIGRVLRMHKSRTFRPNEDHSQRSQTRKPTVIFFVLTVIFLITASPLSVITTYFSLMTIDRQWRYVSMVLYDIGVDLLFINCVINPVVYSFTSTVFRTECKKLLCAWIVWRKRLLSSSQGSQPNTTETS